MSIEKILTVLTMNRGEKLWMGQILKTKPQTERIEIAQELTAVYGLFTRSYIDKDQLLKLQRVIMTKSATKKPIIKTKAAFSVSEMCTKYLIASIPDAKQQLKVNTRAAKTVTELVKSYGSCHQKENTKPYSTTAMKSIRSVSDLRQQFVEKASNLAPVCKAPVLIVSGRSVSELRELHANTKCTRSTSPNTVINTRATHSVKDLKDRLCAVVKLSPPPSPVIRTRSIATVDSLKHKFLMNISNKPGAQARLPVEVRAVRTVEELREMHIKKQNTQPSTAQKIIKLRGNVAGAIRKYEHMAATRER